MIITCLNCGNTFEPSKNDKRIKFCCKECYNEYRTKNGYLKKYYLENKDKWKILQSSEEYKKIKNDARRLKYAEDEEYREKLRAKARDYTKRNTRKRKMQRIAQKYNMTELEYENLLKKQNYKCAICGMSILENSNDDLYVDHNHETNKVRGLLCSNCNFGLGQFKDSILNLQKAIKYLKENDNE